MSDHPIAAALADPPRRIQLRRIKGWRMPLNTVKIDRSTKWGNPFLASEMGNDKAVASLRAELAAAGSYYSPKIGRRVTIAEIRGELAGKNLACWCGERHACHVDVLLPIANCQPEI